MAGNINTFAEQYQDVANAVGQELGVSPAVLLSQWGLETGWGKSIIPGTNNLGNIKDFTGKGVAAKDNMLGTLDKYRAFESPEAFAAEYSALIKRKYPAALGTGNDPVAFATALKAGGYAEDPNYVKSLTNSFNSITGGQVVAPDAVANHVAPTGTTWSGSTNTGPVYSNETSRASWEDLPTNSAKAGPKPIAPHLSNLEQMAVTQQMSQAAATGQTQEQVIEVGKQATTVAPALVEGIKDHVNSEVQAVDNTTTASLVDMGIRAKENEWNVGINNSYSWMEVAQSAMEKNDSWKAISRWYERSNAAPDKTFNWIDNWQEKLAGYSADEQEQLLDSQSNGPSSEAWNLVAGRIDTVREADKAQRGDSTFKNVTAGIAAGVADIPSAVAFMGVGKAFQLGGIGAYSLATAGRGVAAVAASAGEGAVGSMLLQGTLQAAGEHYTVNDWVLNTGMGAGFGGAFGLLHLRGAATAQDQTILREQAEAALAREKALWATAQTNLGPDASQAALKKEVDRIQIVTAQRQLDAALAPVAEDRRLIPSAIEDVEKRSPEELAAGFKRFGLENIPDDAERVAALLIHEGAERITRMNPLDLERVSKVNRTLGVESTSQTLLLSENPVLRAAGTMMLENGAGIAGRDQTVALSRAMNYKNFMGDYNNQYETAYHLWRTEQGGGFWNDMFKGDVRRRFDREVYEAMDKQANAPGPIQEFHPAVAAAIKATSERFDLMRKAQQLTKTQGAARLGDDSIGYVTRAVSAERVAAMSNAEKSGFVQALKQQFMQLNGYDEAFALEHARKYLDIANTRAMGGVEMPLSIHDERASGILLDSLKAMGLTDASMQDIMGRYSRGGANFTKGRANLDLTTVNIVDGQEFRLIDLVDTDVSKLVARYAGRAAGEVALTQFGIQGRAGLESIRMAALHGNAKATAKEIAAFDQVAAELLGQPFGSRIKWVDNATALTSITRLGGMGITQAGESLNGISALGVARTMQSITGMPRLMREATMQAKSGVPKNPIIGSLENVYGEIGMEHYRIQMPFANDVAIFKEAGMDTYTTVDRLIKSGRNVQAKLSFHRAILTAQTRGMSEQIVHKAVRFLREGGNDLALKDMGFTDDIMAALRKDLPAMAKFEGKQLIDFDITKATDATAARAFYEAVNRGAAQIIQGTFIGETGKWAHSSLLNMLLQFRTFGIISVEKQWNRQAGVHGAAKALGVMLGAASFALPLQAARVYAASAGKTRAEAEEYREKQLSPLALARASTNYISMIGLGGDFFDALSIPLGLEAEDTRGLGGGIERIVPTLGLANDYLKAGKTIAAASPLSKRENRDPGKAFEKIVPYGRIPYFIPLVNSLGTD